MYSSYSGLFSSQGDVEPTPNHVQGAVHLMIWWSNSVLVWWSFNHMLSMRIISFLMVTTAAMMSMRIFCLRTLVEAAAQQRIPQQQSLSSMVQQQDLTSEMELGRRQFLPDSRSRNRWPICRVIPLLKKAWRMPQSGAVAWGSSGMLVSVNGKHWLFCGVIL